MQLDWIALTGFRSHRHLEWEPVAGTNLVVGDNGSGKTNLLEAIGYLASLRSFRRAPDEALVHYESESAIDRGEVSSDQGASRIEIEIRRRGGRRALVNGSRLARSTDLLGHFRVVGFLPDDLELVKGGPSERREMIDDLAVQIWPVAHAEQSELDRALRQRNAFLKSGERDEATLAVWDERLAVASAKVAARRMRVLELLAPRLQPGYAAVADRPAEIVIDYRCGWAPGIDARTPVSDLVSQCRLALEKGKRADMERKISLIGPHRDEPVILLDGHDLRFHGSQGEQRTAALSLRLSSHAVIEEMVGAPPVLLLDDVFSELDPHRSLALAKALPGHGQAFVSTAHPNEIPLEGRVWEMRSGVLT